jgi:hypothetical protein
MVDKVKVVNPAEPTETEGLMLLHVEVVLVEAVDSTQMVLQAVVMEVNSDMGLFQVHQLVDPHSMDRVKVDLVVVQERTPIIQVVELLADTPEVLLLNMAQTTKVVAVDLSTQERTQ